MANEDAPACVYRVGEIEVDPALGCLKRGAEEIHLRPRTMQVLLYLLRQRHRLVTREELQNRFWKDTAVTDDALGQCMVDIRRVFGESFRQPRVLRTIPKVGYRFVGAVDEAPRALPAPGRAPAALEQVISAELEFGRNVSTRRFRRLGWPSVAGVALVVVAVLLTLALRGPVAGLWPAAPAVDISLAGPPGKTSLAVMYLDNQSQNRDLAWLREGLTDMLVANLSRSPSISVLSRQELHALLERSGHRPGEPIDLAGALDVARRSRANIVVLGSFATIGNTIRVNVQLHDAKTGRLQGAESITMDGPDQVLRQADVLSVRLAGLVNASGPVDAGRGAPATVMTNNVEAYRHYSLAVERANALENRAALALLEKAIALDPGFAMAHARIGYVRGVVGNDPVAARPHLERASNLPDRLTEKDRVFITAWHEIVRQDFARAIQTLHQIVANYPADMEAYLRLGTLLRGEERYEEARHTFERGLAFAPDAVELLRELGILHAEQGAHAQAIHWLSKAVSVAPGMPLNHERLAAAYRWAGHYPEAIAAYERALALDPTFELAVLGLGNVNVDLGWYRQALSQYRRHLDKLPRVYRDMASRFIESVYLRLGDVDAAERVFAEQKRDDNHAPWNAYLMAVTRGQKARAEKLTEILRQQAAGASRGGLRASERFPAVNRGRVAMITGRTAEALKHFQQVIRSRPTLLNIDIFEDCLANAYLDLGRLDEAIAEYQRVLRLNPTHALSRYHLALAFKRRGQLAESRAEISRFLEIWKDADTDIPELIDAREKLEGPPRGATGVALGAIIVTSSPTASREDRRPFVLQLAGAVTRASGQHRPRLPAVQ